MKIKIPFGIDLGTTRSAAAMLLPGQISPEVVIDSEGRVTMPSVAFPLDEGRWAVGDRAEELSPRSHELLRSVKRKIGRTTILRNDLPSTNAEDISAMILASLGARQREWLQRSYPHLPEHETGPVVITVPAYFDAPQIEATRRAGQMAGLEVAGLLQEPTAAAIYHCWKRQLGDGIFLVYDLGGGTFDVSVIRALQGEYQVLAIDGDNHLGGDDFDRRLADRLRSHLLQEGYVLSADFNDPIDREAFDVLVMVAKEIKEELSTLEEIHIQREALFKDHRGYDVALDLTFSRKDFEDSIKDLVDQTIEASRRALHRARKTQGLGDQNLDGIFLVGGSTRVPIVRQILAETIVAEAGVDYARVYDDDPETSVALGAALSAFATTPLEQELHAETGLTLFLTEVPGPPDPLLSGWIKADPNLPIHRLRFLSTEDREGEALLEPESTDEGLSFSLFDVDFSDFIDNHGMGRLELLDRRGTSLVGPVAFFCPLRPEDAPPLPTLALTNPAVLAKDINLEVLDQEGAKDLTLLPRGSHLPATATASLLTSDASGALVLRLFQHKLPIHTLVMPLPDDARPGTPLDLTIHVDQAMNITATGSVARQSFWVRVDPPALPRIREWEEIESMLEQMDSISATLWGAEARRFHPQAQHLRAGISSALRTDPDRLQVLASRLEALLGEYGAQKERSPGLPRIERLLDTCRRIVFSSPEGKLHRTHGEWSAIFTELQQEVLSAWEGSEDQKWREIADRVQATFESLAQDDYLFLRGDPEAYAQSLFVSLGERIQSFFEDLDEFPLAEDAENRALQSETLQMLERQGKELRRLYKDLPGKSDNLTDMERLSRTLTSLHERLRRVHTLGVPRSMERKR